MGSGDFEPNGAENEPRSVFLAALLGRSAVFRRRRTAPTYFSGWFGGVSGGIRGGRRESIKTNENIGNHENHGIHEISWNLMKSHEISRKA